MAKSLQFRRYVTSALATITGAQGELIVDSQQWNLTLHDGSTPGGNYLITAPQLSSNVSFLLSVNATQNNSIFGAYAQANASNNLAQAAFNFANNYTTNILTIGGQSVNLATSGNVTIPGTIISTNQITLVPGLGLQQYIFDTTGLTFPDRTQQNTAYTTNIPQNVISVSRTLANTDSAKHLYYTGSSNVSLTIPDNGQFNWPIGTTIVIVSKSTSSANVTITPNTNVSLYLAGNPSSASRNVTTYGMATLLNTAANTWFINGSGVV
jgi:hypothetical protein